MPAIGKIHITPEGQLKGRVRVWKKEIVNFVLKDNPEYEQGNDRIPRYIVEDMEGWELGTAKFGVLPNTGEKVLNVNLASLDWPEKLFMTGYAAGQDTYRLVWEPPRKKAGGNGSGASTANAGTSGGSAGNGPRPDWNSGSSFDPSTEDEIPY
ncbi:hypothetical protein [Terasakiella sp. SH-1]|uniref:hypothetical protein n=1 Tax=Terasakiella sp. SH-1 TaxID=2560057 RepID=UPI001073C541|nr:hypothetical protein [Terasakiella sp. SH-1]